MTRILSALIVLATALTFSVAQAADVPPPTGEAVVSPDAKLELLYTRSAPIEGGLTEGAACAPG